ncbi:hypothetical protein DRQ33_05170 [bacterium]|nr:MAG: hypothetical protein DRQ33_05170 [bacterium]
MPSVHGYADRGIGGAPFCASNITQFYSQNNNSNLNYDSYNYIGGWKYLRCRVCHYTPTSDQPQGLPSGSTVLFGTLSNYNGNLGGRSGADAICAAELPSALSGKVSDVKAFISVASNDEIRDLHNNDSDVDGVIGPYESTSPIIAYNRGWGTTVQIASSWQTLLDGNIEQPLSNLWSVQPPNVDWWSGSKTDGSLYSTSYYCNGWTNGTASYLGYTGDKNATSTGWIFYTNRYCNNSYRLVCVAKAL